MFENLLDEGFSVLDAVAQVEKRYPKIDQNCFRYMRGEELVMRQAVTREGFPHGTNSGYTQGCGCDKCRDAHNKQARDDRRRRRDQAVTVTVELVNDAGEVVKTKRFKVPPGDYRVRTTTTQIHEAKL